MSAYMSAGKAGAPSHVSQEGSGLWVAIYSGWLAKESNVMAKAAQVQRYRTGADIGNPGACFDEIFAELWDVLY